MTGILLWWLCETEVMAMATSSRDADVVIVGAGLTGLRAALEVSRAGLSVLVVERENGVGGRVRSTKVDGFILDHGFQVLLTGYPELSTLPSLEPLRCKAFYPGARVRIGSTNYDLLDPRFRPLSIARTLRSPVVTISDAVRLIPMVELAPRNPAPPSGRSTAEYLSSRGFSRLFKGAFLEPFLRGVLLDPHLSADERLARFYLRTFAHGKAVLPEAGMQALPDLLADTLGREHIMLNSPVAHLKADRVVLSSGEEVRARRVICAADALSAAALGGPEQTSPHHSTVTMYFDAPTAPFLEPLLMLNGDGFGPINNLVVLSNVQRSYAPPGRALIAGSIVGTETDLPLEDLERRARSQLHDWFGAETSQWRLLRSFTIAGALPARPRFSQGYREVDGILYAGDYLSYGSQNGALAAGRSVGAAVVAEQLL